MAALFYAAMAVGGGILFAIQAAINAKLARLLGGAIPATMVSFGVGWVVLTVMTLVTVRTIPSTADLREAPAYVFVAGGLLGATVLSLSVFLVPRIGAGATMCLVITGQVLSGLLLDSFGLFGLTVREPTVWRILGAVLVAGGALMVRFL